MAKSGEWQVSSGGSTGEVIVRDGNRIERMYAVAAGPVTWVFHRGAVHRLEDAAPVRRRAAHGRGSVSAPMPATVVSVKVAPGDRVTGGQTLIVLEAMKMELPVRAPGDARVARVNCQPGDLVQPDVSLIDLE